MIQSDYGLYGVSIYKITIGLDLDSFLLFFSFFFLSFFFFFTEPELTTGGEKNSGPCIYTE